MNDKLLEKIDLTDPTKPKTEAAFGASTSRRVAIPDCLTEQELSTLTPAQIDERIKSFGSALGYSALIKMAAGHGEVSQGAQQKAAEFLVERAEHLADKAEDRDGDTALLRRLNRGQLDKIIAHLEGGAASTAEDDQRLSN